MTGSRRAVPDVVVVGSASRDLAADDERGWRLGGGVTYGGLMLARLGLRTAVLVGVDGAGSRAAELDLLRAAGAELKVVVLSSAPVFENIETPLGRIQECLEPGVPIPVAELPDAWRGAPAWLLAPVADELPDSWGRQPAGTAFVGLGWQGLLRVLRAGERVRRREPRPSPLLDRADVVGVGREDVRPGTALADLARLVRPGADLLITFGAAGGLRLVTAPEGYGDVRRYPAMASWSTVDPTGAGDVFLASYLAASLAPMPAERTAESVAALPGPGPTARNPDVALRLAAAAASLVVERPGLLGVPSRAEVAARLTSDAGRRR